MQTPTRSTLSPLLFNIHINYITSLTLNGEFVCYANNAALIVTGDTDEEVFHKIKR